MFRVVQNTKGLKRLEGFKKAQTEIKRQYMKRLEEISELEAEYEELCQSIKTMTATVAVSVTNHVRGFGFGAVFARLWLCRRPIAPTFAIKGC